MDVGNPPREKDRESGADRGGSGRQKGIYKLASNGRGDYVVIDMGWISDLLEALYYKRPNVKVLREIRHRIKTLDRVAPLEVGEVGINPGGIWE